MADPATVTYTAAELVSLANALAPGQPLTARTLRYYTSLQLLDPPITRPGQPARYTDRHLRQLEVVRRRRAAGRGLAEIASEIAAGHVADDDHPSSPPAAATAVPPGLPLPTPSDIDGAAVLRPTPDGWPAITNAQLVRVGPGVQVLLTGDAVGDRALVRRLIDAANPPRFLHPATTERSPS